MVSHYAGTDNPRYYTHFSIKKFNGNTFDLLAYDAMDPGMDVGLTYSQMRGGLSLDPGYYVMSSGPRLADGSVLNRLLFFYIESGEITNVELIMREPVVETFSETSQNIASQLRIVAYLDGGSEPTTHAMQDISILKKEFEKKGVKLTFIFNNEDDLRNFKLKNFNELPKNIEFLVDSDAFWKNTQNTKALPCFKILNSENEVVFEKSGYTIGLGEQLLNVLK